MVSIKDVARHAGVAISTVSKVLNHYPNVSEETKKKVNEAVEELNFLPNSVAAALSSKQAGGMAIYNHRLEDLGAKKPVEHFIIFRQAVNNDSMDAL